MRSGEHREEVSRHSVDCKGSEKTNFFFVDNISKNGQRQPNNVIEYIAGIVIIQQD